MICYLKEHINMSTIFSFLVEQYNFIIILTEFQ